jgi:YHS domain-containing protein
MFGRTRDPVCGMKVQEKRAAATAEYEDKRHYFCSSSCQRTFLENPAKYVAGKVKLDKTVRGGGCCHH